MSRIRVQISIILVIALSFIPFAQHAVAPGNGAEKPLPVFTDITKPAGVAYKIICGDEVTEYWIDVNGEGAAFVDYNNDGYQDLYLANFAKFSYQPELPPPSENSPCKMKAVPIACPPEKYEGEQDLLYHNNGDGTFTDVSGAAGITRKDPGRGFAVAFSDFDNDGDLDIYVANDSGPNFYYINNGNGKF